MKKIKFGTDGWRGIIADNFVYENIELFGWALISFVKEKLGNQRGVIIGFDSRFNSKETADNLKRSGAFVPGIRPGAQTADYIDKVLTRITFWGAMYVASVCLLPEIFRMFYPSMPFNFGGTSLLILVVVTMDFMSQLQAHAMSHQYDGMMKKANLRNYRR